jgi:carboxyl-terminal processing protease
MKYYIKNYALFAVLMATLMITACKKDRNKGPETGGDRRDLTNDSLFLYAKQIYYWNSSLPSYEAFQPRKYTSASTDLGNYENNLFNIGKAANSPDYIPGETFLKYSYIEDITERNPAAVSAKPNPQAAVDLEGNGNDNGLRPVFYLMDNTTRTYALFVTAVYRGSDAEKKGVRRGWLINKINGTTVGTHYENERAMVNAALSSDKVTISGIKYTNKIAGEAFAVELNKTSYKSNPIYLAKIFTAGEKKIGYLAYARFSNEANSFHVLDSTFNSFAALGVTDLIIDLRYNGGGYVSTAEHLINLIAPSSATGVMYKEYFNATLTTGKATIMKNQPVLDDNEKIQYTSGRIVNYFDDIDYSVAANTNSFSKAGNLTGLTNVVFIVSGSTASASELVINSLKPKMTVKLVGEQTYGKPVGFFPIRLENRYDVLFALFETKNALDEGGYFSGMVPDYAESTGNAAFFDDPRYDFGENGEPYTAKAISVLNPSNAAVSVRSKGSVMSINGKEVSFSTINEMKPLKENDEFKGMIETRHKVKR